MVTHLEKKLRRKHHVLPADRYKKGKEVSDAPIEELGWLKKIQIKIKKSFCPLDDRMYEAHVQEKKSRSHQKQIMRALNLPVSDGSEGEITPKEKWIAERVVWSEEEE